MNLMLNTLFALATLLPGAPSQAEPGTPTPPCIQTNTPFQLAYAQQLANTGGADIVSYGSATHSYRFVPLVSMTVCSIGYTSSPNPPPSYRFRLTDTSAPNSLLLDLVTTPPYAPGTNYWSVTPVVLLARHEYLLRRTAQGSATPGQLVGRVLTNQAGEFPINLPSSLGIARSRVAGSGNPPIVNQVLPFIDFGVW